MAAVILNHVFIFAVFLFPTLNLSNNSDSMNFVVTPNVKLETSNQPQIVLQRKDVVSPLVCGHWCLRTPSCRSFNLEKVNSQKHLQVCELLSVDEDLGNDTLTKSSDFDHYRITNPCNCLNGGICVKSKTRFLCTYYRDCSEIRAAGITNDGVYTIDPDGRGKFPVLCDMTTDGGGWTVFHKRFDFSVNFNRNWEAYKNGFGNLSHGEFWLGNEKTHRLTAAKASSLRVDLEDTNGLTKFAKYSTFKISDESDFYRLTVAGYSGTAGDILDYKPHPSWASNGMRFSTPDKDNDRYSGRCADTSGWWFNWCAGGLLTSPNDMTWRTLSNIHMKKASMKLRSKGPKSH